MKRNIYYKYQYFSLIYSRIEENENTKVKHLKIVLKYSENTICGYIPPLVLCQYVAYQFKYKSIIKLVSV